MLGVYTSVMALSLIYFQIIPAGTMPILTKKCHGDLGKIVIINLQPAMLDQKADLIIRKYVDVVMVKLFQKLELEIPEYNPERDPILQVKNLEYLEWTQSEEETKSVVARADKLEAEFKKATREDKRQERKAKRFVKVDQNGANDDLTLKIETEENPNENGEVKIEFVAIQVDEKGKMEEIGSEVGSNNFEEPMNLSDGAKNESRIKDDISLSLKRSIDTDIDDSPRKNSRPDSPEGIFPGT